MVESRAYPTPYFTVVSPISWQGLFPDVQQGVTCCNSLKATSSAVPQNHYSFPSMTGSTNAADPRGWLYLLAESQLKTFSGSQNLSSLLVPATISSVRQHCPHYMCAAASSALGAEGVQMVGALLETSTVHVTGSFTDSASPAATPEQTKETPTTSAKESVKVDPVPATRPTTTAPTTKPAATAVQQVSNVVDVSDTPSPAPVASKTSVENVGVALGQLLDTTVPPGTDTTTATKVGATGVEAASNLLTIDSDLNIIPPTTATTQRPASKVEESNPQAAPAKSTANVGDVIASLLQSGEDGSNAQTKPSVDFKPAEVAIGSTSLGLQPTQLATTISGVSTIVPAVIVGSQTIAVGASNSVGSIPVAVVTAGSQTAVVIDGSSTNFMPQVTAIQEVASQPPIVIGSSSITANSNSQYIVAGQTLAPGSTITVGGTPIALQTDGPAGSVLMVGSSTSILLNLPTISALPPPIVIGSSTIAANVESQYVVAGQTLKPGSAITVGNTPIALQTDGPSGIVLVVGTSSSILQSLPKPTEGPAPIVLGGSTISANSASEYVVAGQTLKPGSSITVGSGSSTSVIALQTSGLETILVIGSSSSVLQQQQTTEVLTVGPAKITPIANSEYLVGSQTLSPGASAVTVSGVEYSLASDGGVIVAGSSTWVLTSEAGIGGYIWSALGGSSEESSSSKSRDASTTTEAEESSTSGGSTRSTSGSSTQPSATETAEGSAGVLRPAGIWSLIALILWVACGA